jgi:dihydroorotate dehydrogenase
MNTYKALVRPWLYRLDPERSHHLAERLLAAGFPWWPAAASRFVDDPRLQVDLGDLHLPNPVGLAPGFDKNGRALPGTLKLGFGYVSVGSVLPRYRAGNPRPRIARLVRDESLVNDYGLPSEGVSAAAKRLRRASRTTPTKLIVNIDGVSQSDYLQTFPILQPLADAVEISTLCPNNPDDSGDLQSPAGLNRLLTDLEPIRQSRLFVKIMADGPGPLSDKTLALVETAVRHGVAAITVPGTWRVMDTRLARGSGQNSGRMTFPTTLTIVKQLYEITGERVAIKALGGIATGRDVFRVIAAGATTAELLTSLVYEGWAQPRRLARELLALMAARGIPSVQALRGSQIRLDA